MKNTNDKPIYIDNENPNQKWVRQGDFMVLVDVSEEDCSHKLQPIYNSVSSCSTILDGYRCSECGKFFLPNELGLIQ